MSLPTVIIFERHWDTIPKMVVNNLLPLLADEGYDSLGLETPHDLSERETLSRFKEELKFRCQLLVDAESYLSKAKVKITGKLSDIPFSRLVELMRQYVSSKFYFAAAEKLKELPANQLFDGILNIAKDRSISIRGMDLDSLDYDAIRIHDITQRYEKFVKPAEGRRITQFVDNILKLRAKKEGLVFLCGALHAENLVAELKKHNMQDEIIYYFPHSSVNYDGGNYNEINKLFTNPTLDNHTYCLDSQTEVEQFAHKIVTEIKIKNTKYKGEVKGINSHAAFLSNIFKCTFQAFCRPGHYVDALLKIDETSEVNSILQKCQTFNVPTRLSQQYLIIPEVNTQKIADNLRKMA